MAYRGDATRVIGHGTNAEKKRLLSAWMDRIELAPDSLEVEIRYKIPEPVVDSIGAVDAAITNYPPLRMASVEVRRAKPLR